MLSGAYLRSTKLSGALLACCMRGTHISDIAETLVIRSYRRAADYRDRAFGLTDGQVRDLIQSPCYYCGRVGVNLHPYRGFNYRYNGIDRVDSSIGYVTGNVVPCCKPCNYAKNELSQSEFLQLARLISARHPGGHDA